MSSGIPLHTVFLRDGLIPIVLGLVLVWFGFWIFRQKTLYDENTADLNQKRLFVRDERVWLVTRAIGAFMMLFLIVYLTFWLIPSPAFPEQLL